MVSGVLRVPVGLGQGAQSQWMYQQPPLAEETLKTSNNLCRIAKRTAPVSVSEALAAENGTASSTHKICNLLLVTV